MKNFDSQKNNPTATILEIVRMSTEDGPGIRTTVFFKGCTLNCAWCHNPESISMQPEVCWVGSRCIGCKTCLSVCPENALTLTETGIQIHRQHCSGCGNCAAACPGLALERMGKSWHMADLVDEVIKDRAYFETSGGGITISGGEPTLQTDFAAEFLKTLRGKGLHTALDTCGQCSRRSLEQVLPYAAMVLFDIKMMDSDVHKQFTGHDNRGILDNLLYIADYIRHHIYPAQLWIRTPMIPGATATSANVRAIGEFMASHLGDVVSRWELCAFNNLCQDKYFRLDLPWAFAGERLLSAAALAELGAAAKQSGVNPEIVFTTGATRLENPETDEVQKYSTCAVAINPISSTTKKQR